MCGHHAVDCVHEVGAVRRERRDDFGHAAILRVHEHVGTREVRDADLFVKFLSKFCQISAKSSQILASKVAFFSIFQNLKILQNFVKILQNFFFQNFAFSLKFPKISQSFANSVKFLQNFANLLARR